MRNGNENGDVVVVVDGALVKPSAGASSDGADLNSSTDTGGDLSLAAIIGIAVAVACFIALLVVFIAAVLRRKHNQVFKAGIAALSAPAPANGANGAGEVYGSAGSSSRGTKSEWDTGTYTIGHVANPTWNPTLYKTHASSPTPTSTDQTVYEYDGVASANPYEDPPLQAVAAAAASPEYHYSNVVAHADVKNVNAYEEPVASGPHGQTSAPAYSVVRGQTNAVAISKQNDSHCLSSTAAAPEYEYGQVMTAASSAAPEYEYGQTALNSAGAATVDPCNLYESPVASGSTGAATLYDYSEALSKGPVSTYEGYETTGAASSSTNA